MQIEIKLLSDACMASGEAYNSSIDTDVQFDKYGLPFIAAKRIKGCLREGALELREWGSDIPVEEMFGEKNDKPSGIHFSNAMLKDHDIYVQEIQSEADKSLVHPQKVLGQFTYTRSQTRIDSKTGTALKDTLRVTRVLKRGLVFRADVEIQGDKKVYEESLAMCCKVLRHMGMNRTRGMGEVQVRLVNNKAKEARPMKRILFDKRKEYTGLDYEIRLNTAAVFKSTAGGVSKTVDYIDGGKILGILASRMQDEFLDFMDLGKLVCTNAYIQVNGQRALPLSASLVKVKNKSEEGRNRAALKEQVDEAVQLNQVKDGYACEIGDKVYLAEVEKQVRYHHSRPDDKGVGHVLAEREESQFYQMESLTEGQTFAGRIYGTKEQLAKIYLLLTENNRIRLGYGKNTEYGEAEIHITSLHEKKECSSHMVKEFAVKCNAPVILYNEYGMYSTDVADMKKTIEQLVGCEVTILRNYLKYAEVGGYNVTWNTKKPTLLAFDKGTLFVCEAEAPVNLADFQTAFLGERNSEGYGEIAVTDVPKHYKVSYSETWNQTESQVKAKEKKTANTAPSDMIKGIWKNAVKDMVETKANQVAAGMKQALKKEDNASAIVNQLLLMQKEYDNEDDFRKTIIARFDKDTKKKQHKKAISEQIVAGENKKTPVENLMSAIAERGLNIKIEKNEVYEWYYKALLLQLKYYLRGKGV